MQVDAADFMITEAMPIRRRATFRNSAERLCCRRRHEDAGDAALLRPKAMMKLKARPHDISMMR